MTRLYDGYEARPLPCDDGDHPMPGGEWYWVEALRLKFGLFGNELYRAELWYGDDPEYNCEAKLYLRDGTGKRGRLLFERKYRRGLDHGAKPYEDMFHAMMCDMLGLYDGD